MANPTLSLAEILAQLLRRVPLANQPLLIAIAERMAADRYRGWAARVDEPSDRQRLLQCAEREEQIAAQVESLFSDASAIQAEIRSANPDLADITRDLFEGGSLREQFALQAQGERLGAATWRALASRRPADRDLLERCAELEERSAEVLESLLQRH